MRRVIRSMIGGVATLVAAGLLILAMLHLGVRVPVVSDAVSVPRILSVAGLYAVLALLFGGTAYATLAGRPWAWPLAAGSFALALLGAILRVLTAAHLARLVVPAAVLFLLALVVLLTPAGRDGLRASV